MTSSPRQLHLHKRDDANKCRIKNTSILLSECLSGTDTHTHTHALTIAPHITLMRIFAEQNTLKGHPLDWCLVHLQFVETFLVVWVKQVSNAIVGNLDHEVTLEKDVPGS